MDRRGLGCLALAALVTACAPSQGSHSAAMGTLPAPVRVIVYPFTATPDAVRLDQALRLRLEREGDPAAVVAAQAAAARDTQAAVQTALVADLQSQGLPAIAAAGPSPRDGAALLVQGRILLLDQGNSTRRRLIGMRAGESRLSLDARISYVPPGHPAWVMRDLTADVDSGRRPGGAVTMGAGAAAGRLASAAATSAATGEVNEHRNAGDDALAHKAARSLAQQIGALAASQSWVAPRR